MVSLISLCLSFPLLRVDETIILQYDVISIFGIRDGDMSSQDLRKIRKF